MEELKEFEEKPSLFKKILIITLSIFLLILLLFYFLTSPQTKSIIYGFIESSKLPFLEFFLKLNNLTPITSFWFSELGSMLFINVSEQSPCEKYSLWKDNSFGIRRFINNSSTSLTIQFKDNTKIT